MTTKQKTANVAHSTFLKDVLMCSLGAYGGPEAHMGVFMDQMVAKRKYLTEEELIELLALCSMLPGPTSTQTIIAIGYKTGGRLLAMLTMLVWATPVLIAMTALSFLQTILTMVHVSPEVLRFIGPMAVGFIILAAWRIGRKVVSDGMTFALMLFGALATYFVRQAWVFPLILIVGGVVSIAMARESGLWHRTRITPPWRYLLLFVLFALGSLGLSRVSHFELVGLFESFYRYGYLVFGGGQVVVPMMHGEFVTQHGYMTSQEFLTGYGLVQGLPGPMFSYAAYVGGMATRGGTAFYQIAGALIGGVGIFLPGLLLIYFVYPVWEDVKKIKGVRLSLKGVNAVSGGMITAAALILMQASGFSIPNITMAAITIALLAKKWCPAPLIVVLALLAGMIL